MKHILSVWIALVFYSCVNPNSTEKWDYPVKKEFSFKQKKREYFLHYKSDHTDSEKDSMWLIIVVHGGGGNGRDYFLANDLVKKLRKQKNNYLLVAPSFSNEDNLASRFPSLGEGDFLKEVIRRVQKDYKIHDRILLTGYSRGGQFTHRFTLQNPNWVKACATFSAGTWTTPKGHLLVEKIGEIEDPEKYLIDGVNASKAPERLHNLFQKRVAEVAGMPAKQYSVQVPFLVMCGTLDTRYEIAIRFAESLQEAGYEVKSEWPVNPHKDREKFKVEFQKYSSNALLFFDEVINASE